MCHRRSFCAFLAATGTLPATLRAQSEAPWKLASAYRQESFHGQNLLRFLQEATVEGAGPRWQLHANNSLLPMADIFSAVREGRVQAGETIMSALVREVPLAGADSIPFLVHSYADARRLWQVQRPLIDQALQALGLSTLMAVPWPPQGLYSTQPLARASDLRGKRMRTYNATTVRIAQLLGATPVEVPMAEVGQALSQGRIECMITSAVTGVENRVWEYAKHYYEINAWYPKNLTFANTRALQSLPPEVQKNMARAAAGAEVLGWAASEKAAQESLTTLRQNGIKIAALSMEFLIDLKRLGERFSLEWVQEIGTQANQIFIPYYTKD